MRKIYIAGPMSGYEKFNFPAFDRVAYTLRREGWEVFNPAEKDGEEGLDAAAVETGDAALAIKCGFDFREAYLWDISRVIESDAIYMLAGWEVSPGACGEHAVAVALKKHYPDYKIIYG